MGRKLGSKNKVKSIEAVKELTSPVAPKRRKRDVPPPWVEELPEQSDLHVIKGFINIQANPKGGFYTAADIHDTVEKAKAVASKQTITQVYIAFEVK